MKPAIVFSLLVTSLVFAQNPVDVKFQDATPKGAPASISVKYDPDVGLYAAVRNTSGKGILAFFAIIEPSDSRGQSVPCHSRADFVFKESVLAPRQSDSLVRWIPLLARMSLVRLSLKE
jgi:hypothetical protein